MLATPNQIPSMVSQARSKLNQYCGSRAHSIQIMVTETNGAAFNPGQRATGWYDGLFLADTYMTMLENGSICDPPAETPFPPYYALQMLTHLGRAGGTMVSSSSSQSLIAVHAVRQANCLAVLLVNKDPSNSYTVSLNLSGYTASPTATIYTYETSGGGITSTSGSSSSVTVAPYSLAVLVLG